MQYKKERLLIVPGQTSTKDSNFNDMHGGLTTNIGNYRSENQDVVFIIPASHDEINSAQNNTTSYCHKLWTTCKLIDQQIGERKLKGGSTAAIVFYDGKSQLITTTIGDSAAFAVVYNNRGKVVSVTRLNSITHKPGDPKERERIEAAGGRVENDRGINRVCGVAISRTFGNFGNEIYAKNRSNDLPDLILSDPKIDTISYQDLPGYIEGASTVQIITTSDGFTDCAKDQSKNGQEAFLLEVLQLKNINFGEQDEIVVAEYLVDEALERGSTDNVSAAVQTIIKNIPVMVAVFDGHGDIRAAACAANHFPFEFAKQCSLSLEEYNKQPMSVANHQQTYDRDNAVAPLSVEEVEQNHNNSNMPK